MRALVLAVAVLTIGACGTERTRPSGRIVSSERRDAVVIAPKQPFAGYYVIVQQVDGAAVAGAAFKTQEFELVPGDHTLEVSYVEGYAHSTQNALLRLVVEEGHRYRIHAASVHEGFWSEMRKGIAGGKGRWVAWIEDEATGAVVSGRRPHGVFTTTFDEPGHDGGR